jgi:hypothetical protein
MITPERASQSETEAHQSDGHKDLEQTVVLLLIVHRIWLHDASTAMLKIKIRRECGL